MDVQVSLSFQESQTENYLTHVVVVVVVIIADIYLNNVKSLQKHLGSFFYDVLSINSLDPIYTTKIPFPCQLK